MHQSQKCMQYAWFDMERARNFALYQNSPSAFLKAIISCEKFCQMFDKFFFGSWIKVNDKRIGHAFVKVIDQKLV